MSMKIRRICIIYAGGTITAVKEADIIKMPSTPVELLETLPELLHLQEYDLAGGDATPANLTQEDIKFYKAVDSTNCTPDDWLEIARLIYERRDNYHGFVVTHGTDTMVYTANALAFLLRGLNKPIVLTGAQLPLRGELVTDARNNLLNACRVAAQNLGEVLICFGSYVLRGCRARKISEFDSDAFISTEVPPIARIGIRLSINYQIARTFTPSMMEAPNFHSWERQVCLVKLSPGFLPATLRAILFSGVKGVVIEGFGAGNIPDKYAGKYYLLEPIREAIRQGITVVVAPQCSIGTGDIFLTTALDYLRAGVISAADMVPEAAVVKLMWLLGQRVKDRQKQQEFMQKSFVGEITEIDKKA